MPAAPTAAPPSGTPAKVISIGGLVRAGNLQDALNTGAPPPQADPQAQPVIQGLAGHIRGFWARAVTAKSTVETEMIEALLARRGEYTPEKLAQIKANRQPAIYMMVGASKMRQIEALMRDVLIGTGADKPWTIQPTPVPELPPSLVQQAVEQLTMEIESAIVQGFMPSTQAAQARLQEMKRELMPRLMEQAREKCEAMERKMEDQQIEGGFLEALDQFITDLATYKTAFLAGPIVRRKPKMSWSQTGELTVEQALALEWERVDPFDIYPAPWATNITRDDFIRKHRLSRTALNEMIGVEGFSEAEIKKVLEQYDGKGLNEWLGIDSRRATAEGKDSSDNVGTGLIDALQYWGSASGSSLIDWGMDRAVVPDPTKEYQIEAWLIGSHVIKAVLNADPLARRPIYGTSFQNIPGSVWGNSPYDLLKDCQDMCNGAARALAANMGIASGPQAWVISNRIPAGEDVTEQYPWKLWQFESDPTGSTAQPMGWFQPSSNANELMTVYERFSTLADEYTGIPRYMAGFETAGAGRTASGMSMMIGNASKVVKQVLGSVDTYVIAPALERQYYHNMRYGEDPELKGDVRIKARGAASLATKEAAQVRTNEFLQVTANPIDMQIIGLDGRAELLRHAVRRLDMNGDKVVPPKAVMDQRAAAMAAQQAMMAAAGMAPPDGQPNQQGSAKPKGQELSNGAPVTDHYEPQGA